MIVPGKEAVSVPVRKEIPVGSVSVTTKAVVDP
jgi:hypothetical protein